MKFKLAKIRAHVLTLVYMAKESPTVVSYAFAQVLQKGSHVNVANLLESMCASVQASATLTLETAWASIVLEN